MKRLIYRSQPFGFDSAILLGILSGARRNNRRDDVTGALFCRHDIYLQLIEGPPAAIDDLYARILADDRHNDVALLLSDSVERRMFPRWDMLHDDVPSAFWTPAEVAGGAIEAAGPAALLAVFATIGAHAGHPAGS